MNKQTYPSALPDEEWEWIEEVIPAAKSGGRPRTLWMRAVLKAIFSVTKGGIQWRMLPVNFPQWQSVSHSLESLETPGGVGQHPQYLPGARPSKRGAAQPSHGGVSGASVGEDHRGGWSGTRV